MGDPQRISPKGVPQRRASPSGFRQRFSGKGGRQRRVFKGVPHRGFPQWCHTRGVPKRESPERGFHQGGHPTLVQRGLFPVLGPPREVPHGVSPEGVSPCGSQNGVNNGGPAGSQQRGLTVVKKEVSRGRSPKWSRLGSYTCGSPRVGRLRGFPPEVSPRMGPPYWVQQVEPPKYCTSMGSRGVCSPKGVPQEGYPKWCPRKGFS
jgi:hypothetical protein